MIILNNIYKFLIVTEVKFKFNSISGLQTRGCWSSWWEGSLKTWGSKRKFGKCSTGWKRKGRIGDHKSNSYQVNNGNLLIGIQSWGK